MAFTLAEMGRLEHLVPANRPIETELHSRFTGDCSPILTAISRAP